MTYRDYLQLIHEANRHSNLYYNESRPEISDADFDALVARIEAYESENPAQVHPDSPTQKVGAACAGIVAHTTPMLSQQKSHTANEVLAWIEKTNNKLGHKANYAVAWKYDGISCSLVYIDGRLTTAATRGDGTRGQDITAHALAIPSIPNIIDCEGRVEVRGEIVCPLASFGSLGYNDARTAASAICNASYSECAKSLVFYAWDVIGSRHALNSFIYESEAVTEEQITQVIAERTAQRDTLTFPTDGLVIRVTDNADCAMLGANKHHPHGSMAYKFAAASCTTTVQRIEVMTGKTGKRTPVAHIEPAMLGGKTIRKVSLYTERTMAQMGVTEGSRVVVTLHNDVTPKITRVVGESAAEQESSDSGADIERDANLQRKACREDRKAEEAQQSDEEARIAAEQEAAAEAARKAKYARQAAVLTAVVTVAAVAAVAVVGVGMAFFIAPLLVGAFKG
ncbi:MAG: hypothetical protein HUK06_01530 [Bacteroidaceae bacterium]|nr:hypothetical protein [Bacteroidaceae bacterium]